MDYKATIKWLDTNKIEDVIITTDYISDEVDLPIEDDYIFFYFKDESEIKEFMKEGVHEFIILDYYNEDNRPDEDDYEAGVSNEFYN